MRVLLIEDDRLLGEGIQTALARAPFTADWLQDGSTGLAALRDGGFDVVVLDLGLPRLDGMSVLRQARGAGIRTPILVLTARDQVDDRVAALDAGADDYLVKPFDNKELLARLRALHRRASGRNSEQIEHGEIVLDPARLELRFRGALLDLPRREFALLRLLLENAGRVVTREHAQRHLYRWDEDVESNAIEVHVHHLRKKLYPELIRTLRGIGYLVPPVEEPKA